jgi:DNA repair protein RadC
MNALKLTGGTAYLPFVCFMTLQAFMANMQQFSQHKGIHATEEALKLIPMKLIAKKLMAKKLMAKKLIAKKLMVKKHMTSKLMAKKRMAKELMTKKLFPTRRK